MENVNLAEDQQFLTKISVTVYQIYVNQRKSMNFLRSINSGFVESAMSIQVLMETKISVFSLNAIAVLLY